MLAVFGFVITGVFFAVFSQTFSKKLTKNNKIMKNYVRAYLALAAAFFGYGIASAFGTQSLLAASVMLGSVLLLVATLLLMDIFFTNHAHKKTILITAGVVGVALVLVRLFFFYPEPYMREDMLFFNSQRAVSFLLNAVFFTIWLPVNLHISRLVTYSAKVASFASTYAILHATATISAAMFLLAKKPVTLVLSFTALSIAFLLLIISNLFILSVEKGNHGKRK